jgi:hypothetical protein
MRNAIVAGLSISLMVFCAAQLALADDGKSLDQNYDKVFPYYTIECAVTQLHKKGEAPGGIGGHALLYMKGVCRDTSVDYPKVKMCDPGSVDLTNKNSGVAASVDKIFMNTRYVAIDGKDFMFHGNLKPDEPLNEETFNRSVLAVTQSGAAKGIKLHPDTQAGKPEGMSEEEYISRVGADTDYAIQFGRETTCVRIPMNEAQMHAEVDKINELNEPFVSGKKVYNWTAFTDSCVDFTHNVLAAAGIRTAVSTGSSLLRQTFDFATLHFQVPSNDVLAQAEWVNKFQNIRSAEDIYQDDSQREAFLRFGKLPQTGGAVMERVPMHLYGNDLYLPANGSMMLDIPIFKPRHHKLEKMLSDPLTTDIVASLVAYQAQLQRVKSERKPIASDADPEFAGFAAKYNQWIDEAIHETDEKLAIISPERE